MRNLMSLAALVLMPANLFAETITFESDDAVLIVRSYNSSGFSLVEFIGEAGAFYQCVVMNEDGDPIATTEAMSDMGQMMIEGVNADDIHDVKCRKVF